MPQWIQNHKRKIFCATVGAWCIALSSCFSPETTLTASATLHEIDSLKQEVSKSIVAVFRLHIAAFPSLIQENLLDGNLYKLQTKDKNLAGIYSIKRRKSHFDIYPAFFYYGRKGNTEKDTLTDYIKKLTYYAITSEFRLDTGAVAKLMDENFISVYPYKTQNKQQELEGMYRSITKMKEEGRVVDSIYLDEFKVQLINNTAIASYYTVVKSKVKGELIPDSRWRWLDVWVEKNGQWKWAASQATPLMKYGI